MKRIIIPQLLTLLMTIAAGCSHSSKVVSGPAFEGGNTNAITVTEILLTPDSTTLQLRLTGPAGAGLPFNNKATLEVDGHTYPLLSCSLSGSDSVVMIPAEGFLNFALSFEPLPNDATDASLSVGTLPVAMELWGIYLTEPSRYPEELPRELIQYGTDSRLPQPVDDEGLVKIKVHYLGHFDKVTEDLRMMVDTRQHTQLEIPLRVAKSGITNVTFGLQGNSVATVYAFNLPLCKLWLAPGDDIDLWIDGRVLGKRLGSKFEFDDLGNACFTYVNGGRYENLNRMVARSLPMPRLMTPHLSSDMSGAEIVDRLIQNYHINNGLIDASKAPVMMTQLWKATVAQRLLALAFKYQTPDQRDLQRLFEVIDPLDPSLLMGERLPDYLEVCNKL